MEFVAHHDVTRVHIRVELGSALAPFAQLGDPCSQWLQAEITVQVDRCLEDYGVPAVSVVVVEPCRRDRLLRVLVSRYYRAPSSELLIQAWTHLAPLGDHGGDNVPPRRDFAAWLAKRLVERRVGPDSQHCMPLLAFIATVSSELVRQHPEDLLGVEQAEHWLRRAHLLLDGEQIGQLAALGPDRLRAILRPVLALHISPSQEVGMLQIIAEGLSQGAEDEAITERLIATFATKVIRVRLAPGYLNRLLLTPENVAHRQHWWQQPVSVRDPTVSDDVKRHFGLVSDGLFFELGIRFPEVVLETDPLAVGGRFRIAVNEYCSLPYIGLTSNEVLVQARPEELGDLVPTAKIVSTPVLPEAAAVAAESGRALEDAGFQVWGTLEYLTHCLAHVVRQFAPCFINSSMMDMELALLDEQSASLTNAVGRVITPGRLARVLRLLLRDGLSIRDLGRILQRFLTFDYVVADSLTHDVFDDRLPVHGKLAPYFRPRDADLAQYVRLGFKRAITRRQWGGLNTLDVYLLDPTVEAQLLDHLAASYGVPGAVAMNAEALDAVCAGLRKETDRTVLGAWAPALVTATCLRSLVRELVADEFPDIAVLSPDEIDLGPDMSFQAMALITSVPP